MNKSKVSNVVLDKLKAIVGSKNFIDDVKNMDAYLSDWRNQFHGSSPLILKPLDSQMVSKILKICNENKVAVVPQGGNTGLVGGSIPSNLGNEIIISLEKMNKIIKLVESFIYHLYLPNGIMEDSFRNINVCLPINIACNLSSNKFFSESFSWFYFYFN